MKRLVLAVFLFAGAHAPVFASSLATEWTYQNILATSPQGLEIRYILIDIANDESLQSHSMLDVLAEFALVGVNNPPFSQKHLVHVAELFKRLDNPRYTTVMSQFAQAASNTSRYISRIQIEQREDAGKIARKLAKRHANTKVPQYIPGTVNIQAMRQRYLESALNARHTMDQARRLQALAGGVTGATLDEIFATAGAPEVVLIGNERATYQGHQVRNVDLMFLYYRGIGRVKLTYERDTSWRFTDAIVDPLRFEREMPYRMDPARFGQPDEATLRMHEVLSGSYPTIMSIMDVIAPEFDLPLELTDTAAEVLLQGFEKQVDSVEGDAYAAICSVLLRSNPSRYGKVLALVAEKSTDVRVTSVASQAQNIAAESAPPYLPGTLSLDAQRRKYPPLYPQSALIGKQ